MPYCHILSFIPVLSDTSMGLLWYLFCSTYSFPNISAAYKTTIWQYLLNHFVVSSVYIEVFLPCLSLNVSVVLVDYNAKRSESLVHVYLGWGEGGGRRLLFLEVYYLAPCVICCWPEIFFITLKCNVFILLLLFAILLNYFFFKNLTKQHFFMCFFSSFSFLFFLNEFYFFK